MNAMGGQLMKDCKRGLMWNWEVFVMWCYGGCFGCYVMVDRNVEKSNLHFNEKVLWIGQFWIVSTLALRVIMQRQNFFKIK